MKNWKKALSVFFAAAFVVTSVAPSVSLSDELPLEDSSYYYEESAEASVEEYFEETVAEEVTVLAETAEVSDWQESITDDAAAPVEEDAYAAEAPAEEIYEEPYEEIPAETPAEEIPSEEIPAETPAEEIPAEEIPAEETPAEEIPTEEAAESPETEAPGEAADAPEADQEETTTEEEAKALITEFRYETDEMIVIADLNEADALPEDAEFVVTALTEYNDLQSDRDAYWTAMDALNRYNSDRGFETRAGFVYNFGFYVDGIYYQPVYNVTISIEYKYDGKLLDATANFDNTSVALFDDPTGILEAVKIYPWELWVTELGNVKTVKFDGNFYKYPVFVIYEFEEVQEEAAAMPALDIVQELPEATISVSAPEGAFPEGTYMVATVVNDEQILASAAEAVETPEGVQVTSVQAFDITFYNKEGEEIEPATDIRVSIVSNAIADADDVTVVHIDDEGAADIVEQSAEETASNEIAFQADAFSYYVMVGTSISVQYLTADGATYQITVNYNAEAGVPEGATLEVTEVTENSEGYDYESYVEKTAEAVKSDVDNLDYVKLFDIKILDQDGNKAVLTGPVDVQITLLDQDIDEKAQVVHFADGAEQGDLVSQVDVAEETVSFATQEFSVYAIVGKIVDADFLTSDGVTLHVTVTFDENEELPEGAVLEIEEMLDDDPNLGDRYQRLSNVLYQNYGNVYVDDDRYISIRVMVDGEKYEPQYPVEVKIIYDEAIYETSDQVIVVHYPRFHNEPEVDELDNADAEIIENEITLGADAITETVFKTESFSDFDIAAISDYEREEAKTSKASVVLEHFPRLMAAGQEPDHDKIINPNGDGTFNLELSVTGDADDETQEAGKVNVLIIYDTSSSMTSNAQGSSYTRADQAEDVVHDFLTNLASYQNSAGDNISVALVTFARATNNQGSGWTTNVSGLANRFDDGGSDRQTNFSYSGTASNGTNWEAALASANTLVGSAPGGSDVPTFVIMMTDGACTASGNGNNAISPTGASITQLRNFYNAATDEAYSVASACETSGGTFYGIYAYGTEADLLDDLMYYSENNQHRGGSINNVVAATQDAPNFFLAADTAALNAAITEIFNQVVNAMGVTAVSISDGTTNQVQTSTGEISELLEVDEDSYQYWLSIPVVNNQFTRKENVMIDGVNTVEEVTYTVTDNGDGTCTVNWTKGGTAKSVTVDGSVSSGNFKYEWTEANDLYNFDPPAAQFVNGAVDWDLSDVGTLLNDVTYSVTFDVYPSQTTLDIIADIKNDPGESGAWGDLDPEIQKYITVDGELKTNTAATLTYSDTRLEDPGPTTTSFENPDPVSSTAVEQMAVSKDWKNELEDDWDKPDSITLNVTRDGEEHYTVTLNDDNDWQNSVFISIGIMGSDGQPLSGAEGHDFTFTEPKDAVGYKWEIDVPTVHPMMINGVETMLIKVDEKHTPSEGAATYSFNGSTYYVDEEAVALTATNERRSSLNFTKVVDGEDAPADTVFPFTFNVVNSEAPETAPSEEEDPGHDSDYWVWISVRDKEGNRINEGVEGATSAGSGWWYAPSGTDVTIPVKADYSIRFNNLPTGTTYTITEGDLESGFIFDNADIEFVEGLEPETAWAFTVDGRTSTGSIDTTNAVYRVVYTNVYELVDINVDKVWVDAGNEDVRPETLDLTISPSVDVDPEITVSEDGTTWTYTWKAVPRYDTDGNEIEYTVTEENVPAGYTCDETEAEDEGTITNTLETTEVTVEKTWVNADGSTAEWPEDVEKVEVQLTADGTAVDGKTASLTANAKSHKFENLPKYKVVDGNEKEIVYSVEEIEVDGYDSVVGDLTEGKITITNTRSVADLELTKTVTGTEDTTKEFTFAITLTAPDGVTFAASYTAVKTTADGTEEEITVDPSSAIQVTLKADDSFVIKDLPIGTEYSIQETPAEGYTPEGSNPAEGTVEKPEEGETIGATVTFNNIYSVEPITASFAVEKEMSIPDGLTGPETWSYDITVAAGEGAPTAETMTGTVNQDTKSLTFGAFTFTAAGTYTYTVTESGTVAGVTNDAEAATGKTVTIEVTDNGDGTLSAEVSPAAGVKFTNTYGIEKPVEASFPVEKEMSIPDGLTGPESWSYDITVAAGEGAPTAETMTGTVDQDTKSLTFGAFAFDTPGTYTYTVTESGTVAGVTNDTEAASGKTVTIEVTDNGNGTLSAEVSPAAGVKFTNTYGIEKPVEASFPVEKEMSIPDGLTGPESWSYDITVAAGEGAPTAETMTGTVDQDTKSLTFGAFAFDTPGTYTYTVTESGTVAGVTNDTEAASGKTVTIEVTDEGNGTLSATVSPETGVKFTNTYGIEEPTSITLGASKTLEVESGNNPPDVSGKYTLTLKDEEGNIVSEKTNPDGAGTKVDFDEISYDTPGEYNYTVTESGTVDGVTNGTASYAVVVTVTDNGDGTLSAEVTEGDQTTAFTNTYKVGEVGITLSASKTLKVESGDNAPDVSGQYTLTLTDAEGTVIDEKTNPNGNGAPVDFEEITYTEPGEYTYTVTESGSVAGVTNGTESYTVVVTVTDNGDGTMTAEVTEGDVTTAFTNTYSVEPISVSFPVQKILEVPEELEGPENWSFTINVAADGDAPKADPMTGTVDQDNDTVTFGEFTFTNPGTYTYTVTENGDVAGVTNDEDATKGKKVTVVVTDLGDGTMTAEADATEDAPLTFTNKYKITTPLIVDPPVKKELTVDEGVTAPDIEGKFTFTLTADEGIPMPKNTSITNSPTYEREDMLGYYEFGEITFEEPGTYTYTVAESGTVAGVTNDPEEKTLTFVVTDNHDGTLAVTPETDEAVFTVTNVYKVTEATVTKIWSDNNNKDKSRPSEITVQLYQTIGEETSKVEGKTAVLNEAGGWKATLKELPLNYGEEEIKYSFKELDGTGAEVEDGAEAKFGDYTYTTSYSEDGLTVTNYYQTTPVKEVYTGTTTTNIDGETVEPGQELSYSITYSNTSGEDVAVTITDTIPQYTTYVDGSADNDGVYADGVITWTAELKNGESITVTFKVTVNDDAAGTAITNKSNVNDGKNDYESNETRIFIPGGPVKEVYSSADPTTIIDGEPVVAGQELLYRISYTNTTGKTAETATIEDTIPANTTYVDGSADNGGVFADGKITWTLQNLAPDATVTVSFKVTVNANNGVAVKNDAVVKIGDNEYTSNETNNPTGNDPKKEVYTGSSTTNIDGQPVAPGETLTYKITYTNAFEEEVNVVITDTIPAFTTLVDGSIDQGGVFADGKITWNKTVAAGESFIVSFQVTVDNVAGASDISNEAEVFDGKNTYKSNETNNHIPGQPVKEVYDSKDPSTNIDGKPVVAGQELVYKITYTNTTGAAAETVTIEDTIPANTTYVDGSADFGGVYADGKINWTLQNIAAGASVSVSFKVTVNGNTGEAITNEATIKVGDNVYTSNGTSNPTGIDPKKEAFIGNGTTNIDGTQVQPGDVLTYKITYENAFENEVNVAIIDTIPAYTTLVEGSIDQGGVFADGKITWNKTVAPGEIVVVSFQVTVDENASSSDITNKAEVFDGMNSYTSNETRNTTPGSPVKEVFDSNDMSKNIDGQTINEGKELIYKISYTNGGLETVNVDIRDTIPTGTTYVEGSASSGGVFTNGQLYWTGLSVPAGATISVTFKVKVTGENNANIENTARIKVGDNVFYSNTTHNYLVPKTGVENNTTLYIILIAAGAAILAAAIILLVMRRRRQ